MVLLLQYLTWTTEIANRLQCLSQDSNKWLTLPISRWNTVHWKDVSYCVANSCFIPFSMELIYVFYECRRKKLKWWLYYLILRSVRLPFFCYDETNFILSTLKKVLFFHRYSEVKASFKSNENPDTESCVVWHWQNYQKFNLFIREKSKGGEGG